MRNLLIGIILLCTFWLLILLGGSLLRTSSNNNLEYIPSDASSIVILHGHELLRHTIEDVILKTHDNELVGIILDQLGETDEEQDIIETGINFNSDVVYYTFEDKENQYNALLVNLSNPKAFGENVKKLYPNVAISHEGDVGLIVQLVGELNNSDRKKLDQIAQLKLKSSNNGFKEEDVNDNSEKIIACVHIPKLERNTDIELDIDVRLKDQSINISGDAEWDASSYQHWAYRSVPARGLHISSSIIPDLLEDTLRGMFKNAMPEIISFSANFNGTEMVESPIFRIVPDIDILLEFSTPFSLDSSLIEAEKINDITELREGSFRYGGILFYFDQIDPLTIYVGRKKRPVLEKVGSNQLLKAVGDLTALTKVEGTGMMKKLLELLSIYKAGKDFLNSTNGFDIKIEEIENGKARVNGSIHFVDNKRPTNEVIRLLLRGDLL